MDSLEALQIGIRFPLYDMDELELLTDLLFIKEQHLDVLFAIASYLQGAPKDTAYLRSGIRRQLQQSLIILKLTA